jgi:hypothetical protein
VFLIKQGHATFDSVAVSFLLSILITLIRIRFDISKNQDAIAEYLGISKLLNKDQELRRLFYKLSEDYIAATSAKQDKLFIAETKATFDKALMVIADLAKGKYYAETEEKRFDLIRSKIRDPKVKSIKAITVLSKGNPKWWFGEAGRGYVEEQKKAIDRGATVTRIFIEPADPRPELNLNAIILLQKDAKIEVLTVPEEILTPGLCANILICNDKWVTETYIDGSGHHRGGWVSTDSTKVSLAVQKFNDLLEIAIGDGALRRTTQVSYSRESPDRYPEELTVNRED